ncbi:helix-turn-helix transcriptional regulator [Paenibacillus rhizophilus]
MLNLKQVSEITSMSEKAIYRLVHKERSDGGIPCVRAGERIVRVSRSDLQKWIESRTA